VRSLEDGMLALGHYGPESDIDPGHPQIHAALTAAGAWREHSQSFVNLSMHEQRLYRVLTNATKTLGDFKTKRAAARQADLDAAVGLHNMNKMLGEPNPTTNDTATNGFVFTSEEIAAESRRHRRLLEAKIAEECHFDRKKFRQQIFSNPSLRS
jgi:hypothetical protein